ncbi:hypothetical protein I302_101665 [Kwoniella bestiolae CBS 10118]|uniref:Uncharacterized protein n=1 Tax=Kwoniella bestiolae CBS 10118 TaxID=1296100 RepID=A0A1B9GCV8_9TREE|nr:hypothetical protein I302_00342 [Kwoniella bestiolae CBS 10118]OCF28852.1 hypothetical protein I302_00342 [Kwoniella bestiolae CBS 10118]
MPVHPEYQASLGFILISSRDNAQFNVDLKTYLLLLGRPIDFSIVKPLSIECYKSELCLLLHIATGRDPSTLLPTIRFLSFPLVLNQLPYPQNFRMAIAHLLNENPAMIVDTLPHVTKALIYIGIICRIFRTRILLECFLANLELRKEIVQKGWTDLYTGSCGRGFTELCDHLASSFGTKYRVSFFHEGGEEDPRGLIGLGDQAAAAVELMKLDGP